MEIKEIHYPILEYTIANKECDRFASIRTPFYSLVRLSENWVIACGGGGSLKSGVLNSIILFKCGPANNYKLQQTDVFYLEEECPTQISIISKSNFIVTTFTKVYTFNFNGKKIVQLRCLPSSLTENDSETLHSTYQSGKALITFTSNANILYDSRMFKIKTPVNGSLNCSTQIKNGSIYFSIGKNPKIYYIENGSTEVTEKELPSAYNGCFIHRMQACENLIFAAVYKNRNAKLIVLDTELCIIGEYDLGNCGVNAINVCDKALVVAKDSGELLVLTYKTNGHRILMKKFNDIKNIFEGGIITAVNIERSGFDDFFVTSSSIDGAIASHFVYHKNQDRRKLLVAIAVASATLFQILGQKLTQ